MVFIYLDVSNTNKDLFEEWEGGGGVGGAGGTLTQLFAWNYLIFGIFEKIGSTSRFSVLRTIIQFSHKNWQT